MLVLVKYVLTIAPANGHGVNGIKLGNSVDTQVHRLNFAASCFQEHVHVNKCSKFKLGDIIFPTGIRFRERGIQERQSRNPGSRAPVRLSPLG